MRIPGHGMGSDWLLSSGGLEQASSNTVEWDKYKTLYPRN